MTSQVNSSPLKINLSNSPSKQTSALQSINTWDCLDDLRETVAEIRKQREKRIQELKKNAECRQYSVTLLKTSAKVIALYRETIKCTAKEESTRQILAHQEEEERQTLAQTFTLAKQAQDKQSIERADFYKSETADRETRANEEIAARKVLINEGLLLKAKILANNGSTTDKGFEEISKTVSNLYANNSSYGDHSQALEANQQTETEKEQPKTVTNPYNFREDPNLLYDTNRAIEALNQALDVKDVVFREGQEASSNAPTSADKVLEELLSTEMCLVNSKERNSAARPVTPTTLQKTKTFVRKHRKYFIAGFHVALAAAVVYGVGKALKQRISPALPPAAAPQAEFVPPAAAPQAELALPVTAPQAEFVPPAAAPQAETAETGTLLSSLPSVVNRAAFAILSRLNETANNIIESLDRAEH